MSSDANKKAEFIVAWYNTEKVRFSFAKQILLAKTWIDICTKNEEYEMAAALQKEKLKVIKLYWKHKASQRTFLQKLKFFIIKLKRKLRK